nr:MAG TPA_asm: hypothetical protein [Caudoviricetes sp.]DAM76044.1 MAG TPA: hypothetical protein [Caudoviricetes sp.]
MPSLPHCSYILSHLAQNVKKNIYSFSMNIYARFNTLMW